MTQYSEVSERRTDWSKLQVLLRCPSCAAEELDRISASEIVCRQCGRNYSVEGNIIDFKTGQTLPDPAFYQNALYRTFIGKLPAIHEAHYGSRFSGEIEDRMKRDLFRLVTMGDGPHVDLGCGAGDGLEFIGADRFTIGVDVQMTLLEAASKRFPGATFICADLANLPFRTGVLTRVFSNAVLEHVFYLERTMEHIQRCLAPDGRFFVGVPTEGSVAVAFARYFTSRRNARLLDITPAESRAAQRMDHCNTINLIENVLRKYFTIEATSLWPFRCGLEQCNLFKSFRLRHLETTQGARGDNRRGEAA